MIILSSSNCDGGWKLELAEGQIRFRFWSSYFKYRSLYYLSQAPILDALESFYFSEVPLLYHEADFSDHILILGMIWT